MRTATYTNAALTAIAAFLAILILRPLAGPPTVRAYSGGEYSYLYVEPGTTILRKPDGTAQTNGKVIIDLRTGDIWGFPTLEAVPYPVDRGKTVPPVSTPMYLGKFDLSKIGHAPPPEQ
jgi:hypothetical protein